MVYFDDPVLDEILDEYIESAYCSKCLQPFWKTDELDLCDKCLKITEITDIKKGN